MQLYLKRTLLLATTLSALTFSAYGAPEGSAANYLQQYKAGRGGGGYNVDSTGTSLNRIYVREGNQFHAMKRQADGTWVVNRGWRMGEGAAARIRESGNFIDLDDAAARRITINENGRLPC